MRSWKNVESTESSFTCWRANLAAPSVAAAFLAAFIILIGAWVGGGNCQAHAQGVVSPVPMPLLPSSVAFDTAGNLYFSDTNRNVVYESSLAGVLSVIAGTSIQGFSGDGGGATSAELNAPQGVAIGPNGTLYIADTGNQRIRAVSAGLISTFAGTGNPGFAGDGGRATSAVLRNPNALAIDASGALLICDSGNQRVRRVSMGLIQTIVGNGTQGFAGDGGAAMNAELDTPMGLAAAPDGRIFMADSHNQRIRVMALNGVISTLAGNGTNGYSGDGGPATIAELSLPRGLIVTASGAVIFADSNNQRIRMVDALGTITTIAGSGLQGQASDGTAALTASLNSPRGVAVSSFGAPVFADALSNLVRESVTDGNVYVPAGLAPNRISLVTLNASFNNGQTDATVSVASRAGAPQGVVVLLDGTSLITQATLVNGAATFSAQLLSPGTHVLTAAYLGDGVNPAATSAATSIDSGTGVITATANPVNIQYGQAIPPLTGSLEGEPAQGVFASFTTTAAALSPVGTYPITASLSGPASANYTLVMSPQSGALQIAQATSITAIQPVTQNSYAGLPLLLNASVASITEGSPTGTVTFADNGSPVASAMLVSGDATGTYISPVAGQHTIVATYAGDRNFLPSVSQSETVTVAAMPDFSMLASGSTTQTVAGGEVATYGMTIAPQMGSFTGVLDFSATGLPAGATASFSPPQIVPGTSSVNVLMSVQTSATLLARTQDLSIYVTLAGLLVPLWIFAFKRRKTMRWIPICSLIVMLECLAGCGARTVSTVLQGGKTYTLTVIGTSTNLAGAVVSHSTQVTLVVE